MASCAALTQHQTDISVVYCENCTVYSGKLEIGHFSKNPEKKLSFVPSNSSVMNGTFVRVQFLVVLNESTQFATDFLCSL